MKKWFGISLCVAMMAALAGCGNSSSTSGRTGNQSVGVSDLLNEGVAAMQNETKAAEAAKSEAPSAAISAQKTAAKSDAGETGADEIDLDLTALSSTMVYSEVSNMMVTPEDYLGKTVKMDGLFSLYHDEETDNYYFACIIQDATACCSQGIEFVLTDEYSYPEDYPEVGDEICVVGEFDTYNEGEYMYCTLRNARMV